MKRHYLLIVLGLLFATNLANAAITVKFQKPDSWTAVSLYTWGPEVLGGWPGTALTEENGWYAYTFDEAFTGANLIFNNAGAGEQTEDFVISATVCLEASSTLNGNGKYDVTVVPCAEPGMIVKFIKPTSWTAVSLYTWGPEVLGGWPGAALTEEAGWYTYTFDATFTGANLIFNNAGAGEQTEDYLISESVCLQASSTLNGNGKYDVTEVSCTTGIDETAVDIVTVYPNPVADNLYIRGNERIEKGTIRSITGSVVMNINNVPANGKIDVSTLEPGVYFLNVYFSDGKQQMEKIMKL